MKNIHIVVWIILFLFPVFVLAQNTTKVKKFSEHPVLFIEELEEVLTASNARNYRKSEKYTAKKFVRTFKKEWESGKYTEENRTIIYKTANALLQSNFSVYPALPEYFHSLMLFMNSSQSWESFAQWDNGINKSIENNEEKQFIFLMKFTQDLLAEGILSRHKDIFWKVSNKRFEFQSDSAFCIRFHDKVDLSASYTLSHFVIHQTKGAFYPLEYFWTGQGGTIDWSAFSIDKEILWAKLPDYTIFTTKESFSADSVLLTDLRTFTEPIEGKLTAGTINAKAKRNIYPYFKSYSSDLSIHELHGTEFTYRGGYIINSQRIEGYGSKDKKATLHYTSGDDIELFLRSEKFAIDPQGLYTESCIFSIIKDTDSIFHPGLLMSFNNKNHVLNLVGTNQTLSKSPIFNSYHKTDIYAEAMRWNIDDSLIVFKNREGVVNKATALFESTNFYTLNQFLGTQGIDEINPIVYTYDFCHHYDTNSFTITQMAHFIGYQPNMVRNIYIDLTLKGFVTIDLLTDVVTIKEKLSNYYKANQNLIDYDNISFFSQETSKNASLNLNTLEFDLFNLAPIELSDSQEVRTYPGDRQIRLLKNRDFIFNGIVQAGKFDMGLEQNAYFSYDTFNIRMPEIKIIKFFINDLDSYNDPVEGYDLLPVRSILENLIGVLYIDSSENKSGLIDTKLKYPILMTDTNYSSVFYNQAYYTNVYPRDRFRFALYPDTLYDLDDFNTDSIEFRGRLISGGIFPDIERPLKTRKDLSLGFVHPTPAGGFKTYGGKGQFTGIADLSLNGLRGDGELKFLGSVSRSDPSSIWDSTDFVFLPDSMVGVASSFYLEPTVAGNEFPMAKGTNVRERWFHLDDEMVVSNMETPMNVYNDSTYFSGDLMLKPNGLFGKGMLEFENTQISSPFFRFKYHELDADTSFLKISRLDSVGLAFTADNYKAYINFEDRKGDFQSNLGSIVAFPLNQYISTMYNFNWFMDEYKIELYSTQDIENYHQLQNMSFREVIAMNELNEVKGPELISTRPDQDSLSFISFRATYTMADNLINAKNIRFIQVADAYIFPKEDNIIIKKNAEMDQLAKSDIMTRHDTIHHHIYNADVQIYSKNQLYALGNYDYYDAYNNKQTLFFDDITVQENPRRTIAKGEIGDTSSFQINEYFDFQGGVKLASNDPYLSYEGYFKIKYDCDTTQMSWVEFDTTLSTGQVRIPVRPNTRTLKRETVFSGLGYNNNGYAYSRFLGRGKERNDSIMFRTNGFIEFDSDKQEYRLGSMAALNDPLHFDNLMTLNIRRCIIEGKGDIHLVPVMTKNKYLEVYSHGTFEHQIITDSLQFDLGMILNFNIPKKLADIIEKDLNGDNALSNDPLDITQDKYLPFLANFLGMQPASDFQVTVNFDEKKFPKSMQNYAFILTDAHFIWDEDNQAFYCREPFGILATNGKLVRRKFKGMMEVRRHKKMEDFSLIIQINESNYYYFSFDESNKFSTYSSNEAYNNLILEEKGKLNKEADSDKKEEESKNKKAEYGIKLASPEAVNILRRRVLSY